MKKAFTMIELIFVIVILGILAAVALPKFLGVAQQAHEGNLKGFTGTLNRTVAPTLWSDSITNGNNGSIKNTTESLSTFVDIPKEIQGSSNTGTFANCDNNTSNTLTAFAVSNTQVTGKSYEIFCRDGNATTAPSFILVDASVNPYKCIAGPCGNFDINGTTVKPK
ncbi:type II secretion system protein [Nautilia lithotrophica]